MNCYIEKRKKKGERGGREREVGREKKNKEAGLAVK